MIDARVGLFDDLCLHGCSVTALGIFDKVMAGTVRVLRAARQSPQMIPSRGLGFSKWPARVQLHLRALP